MVIRVMIMTISSLFNIDADRKVASETLFRLRDDRIFRTSSRSIVELDGHGVDTDFDSGMFGTRMSLNILAIAHTDLLASRDVSFRLLAGCGVEVSTRTHVTRPMIER